MIIPHSRHLVKRKQVVRGNFKVRFRLFLAVYSLPEKEFCAMIWMADRRREAGRNIQDPDCAEIIGGATSQ